MHFLILKILYKVANPIKPSLTDSPFKEEFEFQKSRQSAIHVKESAEIKSLVASFEKPKQHNNWLRYAASSGVILVGGWVVFQQFLGKSEPSELYLN